MSDELTGDTADSTAHDTPDEDGQIFVLLGWAWDVTVARQLASRYPVGRMAVDRLAWMLSVIRTDPDHAARADLERPLLAVPIPHVDAPLAIDGWHRIRRATTTGVSHLPVILLDEADERACRVMGGGIAPQR